MEIKKDSDEYGSFRHIDGWELKLNGRPCRLDGFVVQKVTRRLRVQKRPRTADEKKNWLAAVPEGSVVQLVNPTREDGWVDVAPDEIARWAAKNSSFHLDCGEYWEVFDVSRGRIVDSDQFMSGAFRPPKHDLEEYQFRGTYGIHGVARFFPLTPAQKQVLKEALEDVPLANGLPSTTQDLVPFLVQCLPQFEGVSNEEKLTAVSSWDSNVEFGDTTVTLDRGH